MNKFQQIKVLGEGGYGKAILARQRSDNKMCVIKEVRLSALSPKDRSEATKEAKVLASLKHPNIVNYIASFQERGCFYIVMEYADGGDLSEKLEKRGKRPFSEDEVLHYFIQISLAIKYIHDRKILHRDLKTQNVFLTKDSAVKLGDFGIARVLEHTFQLCRTQIGTPYYLSPEICEGKNYNAKTDIWSLGCILYELCTLKHAFQGGNMKGLMMNIVGGKFAPIPSTYSRDLSNLVNSMLTKEPSKRPTINDVLGKTFIKQRLSSLLEQTILDYEFSHTILHGRKPFASPTVVINKNDMPQSQLDENNNENKNLNNNQNNLNVNNNLNDNNLNGKNVNNNIGRSPSEQRFIDQKYLRQQQQKQYQQQQQQHNYNVDPRYAKKNINDNNINNINNNFEINGNGRNHYEDDRRKKYNEDQRKAEEVERQRQIEELKRRQKEDEELHKRMREQREQKEMHELKDLKEQREKREREENERRRKSIEDQRNNQKEQEMKRVEMERERQKRRFERQQRELEEMRRLAEEQRKEEEEKRKKVKEMQKAEEEWKQKREAERRQHLLDIEDERREAEELEKQRLVEVEKKKKERDEMVKKRQFEADELKKQQEQRRLERMREQQREKEELEAERLRIIEEEKEQRRKRMQQQRDLREQQRRDEEERRKRQLIDFKQNVEVINNNNINNNNINNNNINNNNINGYQQQNADLIRQQLFKEQQNQQQNNKNKGINGGGSSSSSSSSSPPPSRIETFSDNHNKQHNEIIASMSSSDTDDFVIKVNPNPNVIMNNMPFNMLDQTSADEFIHKISKDEPAWARRPQKRLVVSIEQTLKNPTNNNTTQQQQLDGFDKDKQVILDQIKDLDNKEKEESNKEDESDLLSSVQSKDFFESIKRNNLKRAASVDPPECLQNGNEETLGFTFIDDSKRPSWAKAAKKQKSVKIHESFVVDNNNDNDHLININKDSVKDEDEIEIKRSKSESKPPKTSQRLLPKHIIEPDNSNNDKNDDEEHGMSNEENEDEIVDAKLSALHDLAMSIKEALSIKPSDLIGNEENDEKKSKKLNGTIRKEKPTEQTFYINDQEVKFPVARDNESRGKRSESIKTFLENNIGVETLIALNDELISKEAGDNSPTPIISDLPPGIVYLAQQLLMLDVTIKD